MITTLRLPLALLGLLGLLAVGRLALGPLVPVELPIAASVSPAANSGQVAIKLPADSVAAIASRDPFRIGHRPAFPAYDPLRLAEQLAPPPPRPALVLVGVMEGIDPSAVIEGFPGVEGARVVRVGDVIGGLAIKRVGGGRVFISGMDTTWVLGVREPWKN